MITLTILALTSVALARKTMQTAFRLGMLPLALSVSSVAAPPAAANYGLSGSVLAGSIFGQVRDAQGIAQMGAAVQLYNRYEELIGRGLTNEQGVFIFDRLVPDVYSVRVLLASFVSSERRRITVLPAAQNRLDIRLASVLRSTQLGSGSGVPPTTLMTDEWKWVLRSSQATRPVLRLTPAAAPNTTSNTQSAGVSSSGHLSPFSNTTGFVKLSAGDGGSFLQGSGQDLGTAFALSTSLSGTSLVQVSGNVGYNANSALPVAGIRTSYTRKMANGSAPLFVVTARQVYLAPNAGMGSSTTSGDGGPALRTVAAAFMNNLEISPALSLDYGVNLQSISYIQRTSTASPFLRLTYDAGEWGKIRAGASSGSKPTELLARDAQLGADRSTDQSLGLGVLPMVSRSDNQLTMERARSAELGWELVEGSRTYSLGAFDELVSNAAFMLAGATGFLSQADLLPDLSSHSNIFDVGSYQRRGYVVAVKQTVGSRAEVSVSAGRSGALLTDAAAAAHDSTTLRAGMHQGQRNWVTLKVAGVVPGTGTRLSANYGWTDFRALLPLHMFVTQSASQDIGVNFYVRQPLPLGGLQGRFPWRLEATAEIRNLLAQGYLPIGGSTAANPQTILTNSPRAVRGGLNIVF